jgi:hypothetical protein
MTQMNNRLTYWWCVRVGIFFDIELMKRGRVCVT